MVENCIGELFQHVSMHLLILCNREESGSEQNQLELESEKTLSLKVCTAPLACGRWGAAVARPSPWWGSGCVVRARKEPCTLPRGLAADLKQKLCEGENKSDAHPLIQPTQRGSQSKDVVATLRKSGEHWPLMLWWVEQSVQANTDKEKTVSINIFTQSESPAWWSFPKHK